MTGMMVVQAVPDRFGAVADTQKKRNTQWSGDYVPTIRRPTRGIVLKEETFATIRVVTGSGENRWLIDAGSRRNAAQPATFDGKTATDVYSNFFLQTVTEERMEKQQILETFGEPYIFFFGERARVMNFQGALMNSWDFNWEAEWWENYNNELRGTRCVENDARVFLQFDNTLIGGYILSSNAQKNAQERNWVNFGFQMFVTSYVNLSNPELGNPSALPEVRYSFITENLDQYYDAKRDDPAVAAAFRPVLVQAKLEAREDGSTDFGKDVSLADKIVEGWSTGMRALKTAWDSVDGALNQLTMLENSLVNGDNIRIPVGFQGALAFDPERELGSVKVQYGGKITFTVFADNHDEYVGVGDQYASASTYGDMSFLEGLGWDSYNVEKTRSEIQLMAAQKAWAKAGLSVPTVELGMVNQLLHSTAQLGLVTATGIQNWSAYLSDGSAGSASGPFAAVIAP
jgi:hypothetical protein